MFLYQNFEYRISSYSIFFNISSDSACRTRSNFKKPYIDTSFFFWKSEVLEGFMDHIIYS